MIVHEIDSIFGHVTLLFVYVYIHELSMFALSITTNQPITLHLHTFVSYSFVSYRFTNSTLIDNNFVSNHVVTEVITGPFISLSMNILAAADK